MARSCLAYIGRLWVAYITRSRVAYIGRSRLAYYRPVNDIPDFAAFNPFETIIQVIENVGTEMPQEPSIRNDQIALDRVVRVVDWTPTCLAIASHTVSYRHGAELSGINSGFDIAHQFRQICR